MTLPVDLNSFNLPNTFGPSLLLCADADGCSCVPLRSREEERISHVIFTSHLNNKANNVLSS